MVKKSKTGVKLNMGSLSFIGILIIAAIASLFTIDASYAYVPTLLMAVLGAFIAIDNIRKDEEVRYMISVATLSIVTLSIINYLTLPTEMRLFLAGITVAFGISGFIVALGTILKLGWTK
jgi:hypothetical protein